MKKYNDDVLRFCNICGEVFGVKYKSITQDCCSTKCRNLSRKYLYELKAIQEEAQADREYKHYLDTKYMPAGCELNKI